MTNMKGTAGTKLSEFAIMGALYFAKNANFFISQSQKGLWVDESI